MSARYALVFGRTIFAGASPRVARKTVKKQETRGTVQDSDQRADRKSIVKQPATIAARRLRNLFQLAVVEPHEVATAARVDDDVAWTVVRMHVHCSAAGGTKKLTFQFTFIEWHRWCRRA